jgi:PAS domain S-box-containing protein
MAIGYNESIRVASGIVQLGVGYYAFRATRLLGTRRLHWFLCTGFVLMLLGDVTDALVSRGLHYTVPVLTLVIPVLLLIGMMHVQELLKERASHEGEVTRAKDELKRRSEEQSVSLQKANDALKKEVSLREAHQRALEQSEEKYRLLFTENPFPMWVYDSKTLKFITVNQAAQNHYGFTLDEFTKMTAKDILPPDDVPAFVDELGKVPHGTPSRRTCRHRRKDGKVIEVEECGADLSHHGGAARLILITDLTEQRRLEEQFRQSQKMEAIGQLAGGVAHDFNNLLTVISGNADLIQRSLTDPDQKQALNQVMAASKQAAGLTRQLLAFSRRQVAQLTTINLNELAQNLSNMLARLIGEDIKLNTRLAGDVPCVRADPGMIEQVLMNLVVNARDAIHSKGMPGDNDVISVTTQLVTITEVASRKPSESRPGRFVCLKVLDTGCGMAPEVLERLFEPFFTTKDIGKGTGLGLATVYGLIKQHDGWVEVHSKVGLGSEFRIFLPAIEATAAQEGNGNGTPTTAAANRKGTETILLVEDEATVRAVAKHILKHGGYQVIEADCGATALAIWRKRSHEIDLVVTDMVMPGGLTGRQLAVELRRSRPDLKLIFVSGYSPSRGGSDINVLEGMRFIPKPYQADQILGAIREQLDAKTEATGNTSFRRRLAKHASTELCA